MSYWPPLSGVLDRIKGIAHITGGGIAGNVERVLPDGVRVELDSSQWAEPPIFELIQERGNVSTAEMYRVFNMGLGIAVIVSAEDADDALDNLEGAARIGASAPRGLVCIKSSCDNAGRQPGLTAGQTFATQQPERGRDLDHNSKRAYIS